LFIKLFRYILPKSQSENPIHYKFNRHKIQKFVFLALSKVKFFLSITLEINNYSPKTCAFCSICWNMGWEYKENNLTKKKSYNYLERNYKVKGGTRWKKTLNCQINIFNKTLRIVNSNGNNVIVVRKIILSFAFSLKEFQNWVKKMTLWFFFLPSILYCMQNRTLYDFHLIIWNWILFEVILLNKKKLV